MSDTARGELRHDAPAGALAAHGGRKVRNRPMPPRLAFVGTEAQVAVEKVLAFYRERNMDPGYQGEFEQRYCRAFVEWTGTGWYANAVNTGTAAVFVALAALGLPVGSSVVVSPVTAPGTISAIIFNQLRPVLMDSRPGSLNSGADDFERRISKLIDQVPKALFQKWAPHPFDVYLNTWIHHCADQARKLRYDVAPLGEVDRILEPINLDIAASTQLWLEETMLQATSEMLRAYREKGIETDGNLCLSGGTALNCPANSRIYNAGLFTNVQTVNEDSPEPMAILTELELLPGIPIVMNTSFNGPGQPIIETAEQALQFCVASALNAMFIDDFEVTRA